MSKNTEFCPVLSFLSRVNHYLNWWGIGGFACGVVFSFAIGGTKDPEKAIWFTAGIAVTSIATAYQTFQSNQRAKEERENTERQLTRERTAQGMLVAYEHFLQCSTDTFKNDFVDEEAFKLYIAYTRVELIGSESVASMCKELVDVTGKVTHGLDEGKELSELSEQLSEYKKLSRNITKLMRKDTISKH